MMYHRTATENQQEHFNVTEHAENTELHEPDQTPEHITPDRIFGQDRYIF